MARIPTRTARVWLQRFADGESVWPRAAFWRHEPVLDQDAEALARATLAFQQATGGVLAKVTPASSWQLVDLGVEDAWTGDEIGRRDFVSGPVHEARDWDAVAPPGPAIGMRAVQVEAVRLARRLAPVEVPIVATIFSPLFLASKLALADGLHRWIDEAPGPLAAAIDRLGHDAASLARAFADAGADAVFLADQQAGDASLPEYWYQSVARPALRRVIDAAPEAPVIMHHHGRPPVASRIETSAAIVQIEGAGVGGDPSLDQPQVRGLDPVGLDRDDAETSVGHWTELIAANRGRPALLGATCCVRPSTSLDLLRRLVNVVAEDR